MRTHCFVAELTASWPTEQWRDLSIVLAVSGGPDSVALLRAMVTIKDETVGARSDPAEAEGELIVGHFNHGLRPEEADAEQEFVESLCRQLGVRCEAGRADVGKLAEQRGDGLEAAARELRYEFLRKLAERHGARYIVTGHTADDQAETILHRVVRGTGLRGLSGMPRARPLSPAVSLLRPLLSVSRASVQTYLTEIAQPCCTDASNSDLAFTRNRIRNRLLPMIQEEFNPQAKEALVRLGQLAGDVQTLIDQLAGRRLADCIAESTPEQILLNCGQLSDVPDYLIRELLIQIWRGQNWPLQAMGKSEWASLAAMVQCETDATTTLPGSVLAKKEGGQLSLTRPA